MERIIQNAEDQTGSPKQIGKRGNLIIFVKRNFTAEKPCEKCVTDITKIPAKDGKLYVSAIFDCFDVSVLELAMADNIRTELCVQTLENACKSYRYIRGAIIHSDRGSQYTSEKYRFSE